jgi:hypothetical protein
VMNVDGNPSYPRAITELNDSGELGRCCSCRPIKYLNNILEQDHRAVKRRVRASQGFRAFHSVWRTLQGIEAMNMIRKGQVRWIPKGDIVHQAMFIEDILGLTRAMTAATTDAPLRAAFVDATLPRRASPGRFRSPSREAGRHRNVQ